MNAPIRLTSRHVEELIDRLHVDYMTAADLVAAVLGQLRHRYDGLLSVELEHCFKGLLDQLDEEQMCEPEGIDEMTIAKWEQERQREEEELMLNEQTMSQVNDEA